MYVEVGMISGEPTPVDRAHLLTEVTDHAVERGRLQRGDPYHFEIGAVPPVHVQAVADGLSEIYDGLSVAGMDQMLAHHRENPTWWMDAVRDLDRERPGVKALTVRQPWAWLQAVA